MYGCINDRCGRSFPRQVAFCPYCGQRQQVVAEPPAVAASVVPAVEMSKPPSAALTPPAGDAPDPAPNPRPKLDVGRKPSPIPEPGAPVRATASSMAPKPIRKRTWLLVALALAAIWIVAKPRDPARELDKRVDAAIEMAGDCQLDEARAELAALRTRKAKPEQLKRLQKALAESAPGCERKRARGKAWSDTTTAVDGALRAAGVDKAASRLALFVRRWGEDAGTRALNERIERKKGERLLDEADACLSRSDRACADARLDAAERLKRPELDQRIAALRLSLARKSESAPPAAQPAGRVLADAERDLGRGDYRGAIERLETCLAADAGNRDCQAKKQKAERLNRDMLRCVASGADWMDDRCQ